MVYLDIIFIVNGAMDAFLLASTAYLLRRRISKLSILVAVIIGEIPILFILLELSALIAVSKVLIPIAMVGIGLQTRSVGDLAKGLLYFSLLAAFSGGTYYALTAWLGITGGGRTFLTIYDLWFLPVTASIVMGGYRLWEKMQKANLYLDNVLYNAEITFDNDKTLKVKALLDTGNELKDPLTGMPVMLIEERIAQKVIPEKLEQFLRLPWRESANPWSFVWNNEEYCRHRIVFISAKGINGQTWLPGIRLEKVVISQGEKKWEHPVTVALVPGSLSAENKFQALLHPELIAKPAGEEDIA